MKTNQLTGLNRQARKFLMENLISTKAHNVHAFGFTGYVNGDPVEDVSLSRVNGTWVVYMTDEEIQSINGTVEFFNILD